MLTIENHTNGKVSHDTNAIYRELATLRAENRRLMKTRSLADRFSSTVHRAIVDAHMLIMRAFSGDSTGMRATKEASGMSKRRWQWAVALLRYAGVVRTRSRRNWRNGLDWVITDLDESVRLLEKAGRELDGPEGYGVLKTWRKGV